jgi:hypothetical protein
MLRVALAAVAVALLAAPSASPAPSAHNPISFTDPAGDAGGGPDITGATISNTAAGVIRFQIAIANATILPDNHLVGVFINADRDASTGFFGGFEYAIQAAGALGQAIVGRWDGMNYAPVSAPSLVKVWVSGGSMTFQISSAELGNTTGFTWWAVTEALPEPESDWDDTAPDGLDVYSYTVAAPHIGSATARYSSAAPRAGRRFTVAAVTLRLSSDETVPAASFRCRATLGGRAIRGAGRGGCTFSIPRSARGKRLTVTVDATLGSESRTVRRTFRVR